MTFPALTFLGTGGAFTDFRVNYHNNLMVDLDPEAKEDRYLLIDCGGTAVQSTKELGIKPWEVRGVLVTHLHGDHINGIEQLLWERFYLGLAGPGWRKTKLYSTRTILDKLRAVLTPCVDEVTNNQGASVSGGYDMLVEEVVLDAVHQFDFSGTLIRLVKSEHVVGPGVDKETYGVRIAKTGAEMFFTSDTTFDPDIGAKHPDAAFIFHDCTFSGKYPGTVHTHYSDLLTLPPQVRARMVLMHHTQVPDGIDVKADGFRDAAKRHQIFLP